ncbi:MAG TPA: ATP-binding protein [Candidatus Gallacutalibacter pullicola]|uniref:ATP-binding protein n=1 Tax=Candidatus Gallacutalibacter pullicola TaxID=2840830 RepID=A0A9D1J0M4_9FIRM|nr:ATP-binding protein [Candidatus Gallacutalibacter pullicola]
MGYGKDVYQAVMEKLNLQRVAAEQESRRRRDDFYAACPRAAEIERLLSHTAVQAAKAVLGSGNSGEILAKLKENNLALQEERRQLLASAGLPEDYLQPHYQCPKCEDTGYIDGRMCSCLKELLRKEAYRRLNDSTPLSLCTFDSFSLSYYPDTSDSPDRPSPRAQIGKILSYCRRYAANFSPDSPSLLMQGGTGLGKTHLSLSIANEAIERGFGVIYGSTQNLASSLEKERFRRDSDDETNQMLLSCDLLILDDLGTEFSTSFIDAAIYNIVNTRLMSKRPTIISTNLSLREMETRYTERFVSRIIGSYIRLFFYGSDVRQQRRSL